MAMIDEHPLGGTLRFRMWVTRGCFFVLSDRLKRKARYSIGAITLLSFYVFTISMMALIFTSDMPKIDGIALSSISIILSVLIIIVTLLENSKEYPLGAEHAFQTAHALENLYNRYEALLQKNACADDMDFRNQYNEILRAARLGRKAIDYHQFQLQNAAAFGMSTLRIIATAALVAGEAALEYWIYATMAVLPPLGTIVFFTARFGP